MGKSAERKTRLEAAAKDLLDALERAVEHAETHNDYDWIGAAIKAINKAKGKEKGK